MRVEKRKQYDATAVSNSDGVRPDVRWPRPAFSRLLAEAGDRQRLSEPSASIASPEGRRTIRTVRQGDTLSHIVEGVMRQAGIRVSPPAIYRAVEEVARANRIANPDRVRPGQTIDVSAVTSSAKPNERNVGLSDDGAVAEAGVSAGSIVHGLKAFMQSLAGRVTSSFGHRADPMTGSRAFHAGVDIKFPAGSFIYPALPGRVVFSGQTRGYGNLIILAHAGGFTTSYGHNSSNLIPAGEVVDQKMPIAIVGATGRATGPHLHFEVRRDGHPIDPDGGSLESGDQDG